MERKNNIKEFYFEFLKTKRGFLKIYKYRMFGEFNILSFKIRNVNYSKNLNYYNIGIKILNVWFLYEFYIAGKPKFYELTDKGKNIANKIFD